MTTSRFWPMRQARSRACTSVDGFQSGAERGGGRRVRVRKQGGGSLAAALAGEHLPQASPACMAKAACSVAATGVTRPLIALQ